MLSGVTIGANIGRNMVGASEKSRMENSVKNAKAQELFHKREGHGLNVRLCVKFVETFVFTGIHRLKAVLFHKRYSVWAS